MLRGTGSKWSLPPPLGQVAVFGTVGLTGLADTPLPKTIGIYERLELGQIAYLLYNLVLQNNNSQLENPFHGIAMSWYDYLNGIK